MRDRHEGRQPHYRAQFGTLAPLIDGTSLLARFWQSRFDHLEDLLKRTTNDQYRDRCTLTQLHLIEEGLMKNDFKPVVDHRFSLRTEWGAVDCQVMAVLECVAGGLS